MSAFVYPGGPGGRCGPLEAKTMKLHEEGDVASVPLLMPKRGEYSVKYLNRTADEYRAGMRYFKQLGKLAQSEAEQNMAALAEETLRFAALRAENPPLTMAHLKQMHGQPVYCSSFEGGPTGGGIIDAHKEQVILLDHNGVWRDSWFWNSTGKYYRFPLNGVDLLGPDGTDK